MPHVERGASRARQTYCCWQAVRLRALPVPSLPGTKAVAGSALISVPEISLLDAVRDLGCGV